MDVIKLGAALLAFIMTFYALTARERKTPYITVSVYSAVIFILFVIAISMLSTVTKSVSPSLSAILQRMSEYLLIMAVLYVAYRIWRIHNRHMNFRDDKLFKNLVFIRYILSIKRSIWNKPSYEHSPIGIPDEIVDSVISTNYFSEEQLKHAIKRNNCSDTMKLSLSAVCKMSTWVKTDLMTTSLAICFLQHNAYVQYITSARHPAEFILQLKDAWETQETQMNKKDWREVSRNIVTVDAYTPHFGFVDTTHGEWTKKLKGTDISVTCLPSKSSFAGVHTSAAIAFNVIKGRHQQDVRHPTLLIYEGLYGLVDLESIEQYRIFIRHLLPSERLWGGMFTFIVETEIPNKELELLQSYTDLTIDNDNS